MSQEILTLFEEVLRKNSSSLAILHFVITRTSEDLEDLRINIPTMPKLQELKVGYNVGQCNSRQINVEDLMWYDNIGLNWGNGNENLNYAKHLPSLDSLILWTGNHDQYEYHGDDVAFWDKHIPRRKIDYFWRYHYDGFFRQFIPTLPQICKSLKFLDVPYRFISGWEDQDDDDRNHPPLPRSKEIAEMFPNVWNEWLNEARK
jgi:hypothetical protein